MERSTLIKVVNRDNGSVIYSIPEMNGLRRVFQPGETKEITFEEIEKLSWIPGGKQLLQDSLVILNNAEAVKSILGDVEPEYSYTKEDLLFLMQKGSIESFLDCLDFAPEGVVDLIKYYAVQLPLNDVEKREAILQKTGFNVDNAIRIKKESSNPDEEKPVTKRRVRANKSEEQIKPTRRVTK